MTNKSFLSNHGAQMKWDTTPGPQYPEKTWHMVYRLGCLTFVSKDLEMRPFTQMAMRCKISISTDTHWCKDDKRWLLLKIAIWAIPCGCTIARQSQLRVKLAIYGIASELNRLKTKACEWKWLLVGLRSEQKQSHTVDNRLVAIEVASEPCFTGDYEQWRKSYDIFQNPVSWCENAAIHQNGVRRATEKFWMTQASEVLRAKLVTLLARDMR